MAFWHVSGGIEMEYKHEMAEQYKSQKQPSRGVLRERFSEKMLQISKRTPMPKCNFIEIALRYGCSPVNLSHVFKLPFPKNSSGRLLLKLEISCFEKIKEKM